MISSVNQRKLIILFDGGCPLCQREVSFLSSRDSRRCISFVDIDSPNYEPIFYKGISYREAMGRIHAITPSGEILKDVRVFREAYRLVGLGWIYAPTTCPLLAPFVDKLYEFWAQWRFVFTFRPSLNELCARREVLNKEG
ncbi:thiol-disulfide oxidoreductase DCC family protein [Prochlorococcus marinus]|uniref:thiol-disulfide oxidoreductase DCC family protein n=1 Tax=Prochlorococcus marinus TaxID=1219 RepID=UPI0022B5044E|nr:DUF393 domain-containing protein [Prochlorococcus marinus]